MQKKHIGRTVYDSINFGEGKIIGFSKSSTYPNEVEFKIGRRGDYTIEGKADDDDLLPTLSFTPYTLEGYTNTLPKSLPKVGEQILVSDNSETWFFGIFSGVEESGNIIISSGHSWKCYKRIKEIE